MVAGGREHGRVVGGERGVDAVFEERLHQPHERRVHVRLARPGDGRGLLVGPLAQPHAGAEGVHPREIVGCPVEIGLQHHPDVAVAVAPDPLEDVEGGIDPRRLLHVDADEAPVAGRVEHPAQVGLAGGGVDAQAELGELDGDLTGKTGFARVLHHAGIGICRGPRRRRRGDGLSEVVQGAADAPVGQRPSGSQRIVDPFSGDEPPGEPAFAHPVARGEPLHRRACREGVEQGARQGLDHATERPKVSELRNRRPDREMSARTEQDRDGDDTRPLRGGAGSLSTVTVLARPAAPAPAGGCARG